MGETLPFDDETNEKLNKFLEVFNMAAKIAYVVLNSITRKEGFTDNKTGEPQTKYGLKCTGKSGKTVWFNLFSDPEIENTILADFGPGQGMKVTFLRSGPQGQFKNVVGLSHAQVNVPNKDKDDDKNQDAIMMQACLKAAGGAVRAEYSAESAAQYIWDIAEELFLKLTGRRYGSTAVTPREKTNEGGTVTRPASEEMTQAEAESYMDTPESQETESEEEQEIPF